jgi:hypothetical protein
MSRRPTSTERHLMQIMGLSSRHELMRILIWIEEMTGAQLRDFDAADWFSVGDLSKIEDRLVILKEHLPKATGLQEKVLDHLIYFRRVLHVTNHLIFNDERSATLADIALDLCEAGIHTRSLPRADPNRLFIEIRNWKRNKRRAEMRALATQGVFEETTREDPIAQVHEVARELFLQQVATSSASAIGWTPAALWPPSLIREVRGGLPPDANHKIEAYVDKLRGVFKSMRNATEQFVFLGLLEGLRQTEIASAIGLSPPSISNYTRRIHSRFPDLFA